MIQDIRPGRSNGRLGNDDNGTDLVAHTDAVVDQSRSAGNNMFLVVSGHRGSQDTTKGRERLQGVRGEVRREGVVRAVVGVRGLFRVLGVVRRVLRGPEHLLLERGDSHLQLGEPVEVGSRGVR